MHAENFSKETSRLFRKSTEPGFPREAISVPFYVCLFTCLLVFLLPLCIFVSAVMLFVHLVRLPLVNDMIELTEEENKWTFRHQTF